MLLTTVRVEEEAVELPMAESRLVSEMMVVSSSMSLLRLRRSSTMKLSVVLFVLLSEEKVVWKMLLVVPSIPT